MKLQMPPMPVLVLKSITLAVGFVLLVLGLTSHYQSAWVKDGALEGWSKATHNGEPFDTAPYEYCGPIQTIRKHFKEETYPRCPPISMEIFFVGTTVSSVLISLLLFMLGLFEVIPSHRYRTIDIIYHIIACVTMLLAGIFYLVSANQIESVNKKYPIVDLKNQPGNLRTKEKVAAGSLGIVQSLIFGVIVIVIRRYEG